MSAKDLVLEIVAGESAGRQIPISKSVELGRDPSLEAHLDDEQISRHHARVSASAGGVVIADLGSTNGTYVNDQPVEGAQRIAPGDHIRLGLTVMQLRSNEQLTVQGSAVEPAPQITALGRDVLEVVPEEELAPVEAEDENLPGLLVEASEPAFVQSRSRGAGDAPAIDNPGAIAKLVDVRVKHQTNVAAFALLGAAGLAVLIYFGVR